MRKDPAMERNPVDEPKERPPGKARRGFAAMSPEKRRAISSLGGKRAHAKGAAHTFTTSDARYFGQRGGLVVSRNRDFMARIGKLGGKARAAKPWR
jgi:hypothetical protein